MARNKSWVSTDKFQTSNTFCQLAARWLAYHGPLHEQMSSGETKERQCFIFNDIFLCTKAILHKRWAGSDTSVATYEYKWGHAMASCLEVKYKGNPVADTGMKDNNGNPVMIYPIVLTFQTERVRQKRILYALSETDRTAWGQELERVRQGTYLECGIGKNGRS